MRKAASVVAVMIQWRVEVGRAGMERYGEARGRAIKSAIGSTLIAAFNPSDMRERLEPLN